MASLLVSFSGQILKWQEPASAAVETIYRLLNFSGGREKFFPVSETSFNLL
jgi:hypothetical protein